MTGKGHPLPGSEEARHNEIPEHVERDKGRGDDAGKANQPAGKPVSPEGKPYAYADLGRGPDDASGPDEFAEDQAAHQDRGQDIAENQTD